MRWHTDIGGLWEKGKACDMFQEMGMDYWLARTEKALQKLQRGVR